MVTNNSWNNNVLAAGVTFSGGIMSIGTDSTDNAINIGTAASAGRTTTIGNATGTSTVAINCGTGGVTVGTSATAHATTIGSTNTTSATTMQSGSGALNITSTNGAITMNSGTGTVGIGTDATAATYNFATGGGAKVVTLGTTTTSSSLALKTGTADFSLTSATGTIITALDTGEVTFPLQPAFLAQTDSGSAQDNVTGDGTFYTILYPSEIFDKNSDFSSPNFTAPVTGSYWFFMSVQINSLAAGNTTGVVGFTASNRSYTHFYCSYGAIRNVTNIVTPIATCFADMDAADTCFPLVSVSGGTKIVDIGVGGTNDCRFGGFLQS